MSRAGIEPSKAIRLLRALPADGGRIAMADLVVASGFAKRQIYWILQGLKEAGFLTTPAIGVYRRTPAGDALILTGNVNAAKPRKGCKRARPADTLTDRVWRALRIARRATIAELLTNAMRDESDGARCASSYLARLRDHGITAVGKRKVGIDNGPRRHQQHVLIRDLGPKAPIWRPSVKQLIDPNSGSVIPLPEADHG